MRKVILQLQLPPDEATISSVRRKLHLAPDQIDAEFGVRRVRPPHDVFAVKVDSDVAAKLRGERRAAPGGRDVKVTLVH
jgi:hypothetical protein